ncbi:MAG: OmpA family protein, partial [Gammaproteobacteria bacterium]
DSSGGAAYNLRLSQRRAEAIKTQLVRAGVDAAIVTTRGFGESKPIAPNNTSQGRAKNRRVEIKVNAIR